MNSYKKKSLVIAFIVALITLACLLMNGPMRGGLPLDNTVVERMTFIAQNSLVWTISWTIWMCCALGLLVFCTILADELKDGAARRIGIFLVALGVAPDLTAEVIYAFVLPKIVEMDMGEETFALFEFIVTKY